MKGYHKILLLLMIPVSIILVSQWVFVISFFNMLLVSGWVYWLALLPLAAVILVSVFNWLGIWASLKAARRMDPERKIPQVKRIELAMEWCENHWLTRTAGRGIYLVNNYITPKREDTESVEIMMFSTSKAYMEKRIQEDDIPKEECFYVSVNCSSGECMSMDFLNKLKFENAVKFFNRYWLMGIRQKVETPIEQWMKKAMAETVGENIMRQEMSKEEIKDEKD